MRLDEVAAEAVEFRKRLNGSGTWAEAADHFVRNRPKVAPTITVRAAGDEFIEWRKKEEVDKLYLRDIRLRLGAFADAFNCPIGAVTPAEIVRSLGALSVAKRTRYNYRGSIGTLLNFAKERRYWSAGTADPGDLKSPSLPGANPLSPTNLRSSSCGSAGQFGMSTGRASRTCLLNSACLRASGASPRHSATL